MNLSIYRILDANLNRSREGLRVCEEVTRFILGSDILTRDLKKVRHSITGVIKRSPERSKLLFEVRDTETDVGKISKSGNEKIRHSPADIFSANIERVKESLRVLEEFFKLLDKKESARFKAMRFEVYDIEKRSFKKFASLRHTG